MLSKHTSLDFSIKIRCFLIEISAACSKQDNNNIFVIQILKQKVTGKLGSFKYFYYNCYNSVLISLQFDRHLLSLPVQYVYEMLRVT